MHVYICRKIAIVLVVEKPQTNATQMKEQHYQSAYDQLSAIVLSIIEVYMAYKVRIILLIVTVYYFVSL